MSVRLAPDGTYVYGQPMLAPNGTYVGGGAPRLAHILNMEIRVLE